MFEGLTSRLKTIFDKLSGYGKLTESNIQDALREVRVALLEADVNFKVVKSLIDRIKERAIGQEVLKSLMPGQQVIKIVHQELVELLGGIEYKYTLGGSPPCTIMLVGLQGSGKTTTAAKLARWFQRSGFRPMLVAADIYRPAAFEQLRILGKSIGVDVEGGNDNTVRLCQDAIEIAISKVLNPVIIDTAGRLHIDTEMIGELKRLKTSLNPHSILLIADAMTGQDAVRIAEKFNNDVGIDGVILSKMDGDARGGAALSIRAVIGKPIIFAGTGEKIDALELFYPDRMASRILGMGDVLTLIEKAQAAIDEEKAKELAKKIQEASFTLEDFQDQIKQIRKMGSLDQILEMIPFAKGSKGMAGMDFDDSEIMQFEAIINSMTKEERHSPNLINGSRRLRIARGSGTSVQEVNRLLKNYFQVEKMVKSLSRLDVKGNKYLKPFRLFR